MSRLVVIARTNLVPALAAGKLSFGYSEPRPATLDTSPRG